MNKFKLAMALCLTAFFAFQSGCAKKTEETTDEDSTGGGGTSKPLLSSWATSNAAWAIRLDLGANNSGTNFSLVVKFSDDSEVHCTGNLNGTDTAGTYTVSSCTDAQGGTHGSPNMSTSTGATTFETGGAGTYAASGTGFTWCKANTSCFTYY